MQGSEKMKQMHIEKQQILSSALLLYTHKIWIEVVSGFLLFVCQFYHTSYCSLTMYVMHHKSVLFFAVTKLSRLIPTYFLFTCKTKTKKNLVFVLFSDTDSLICRSTWIFDSLCINKSQSFFYHYRFLYPFSLLFDFKNE